MFDMFRFRESRISSTLVLNPSIYARRDELQKAFDEAGIPGKWEIGYAGSMIFDSDCRNFELNMPYYSDDGVIVVTGPNPSGFIFSLSPPRKGSASIPVYSHPESCLANVLTF